MSTFEYAAAAGIILMMVIVEIIRERALMRYKKAFRDTATQLYNVTIERDKLAIQNAGLKAELARECVKNERLEEAFATASVGVSTMKPGKRA